MSWVSTAITSGTVVVLTAVGQGIIQTIAMRAYNHAMVQETLARIAMTTALLLIVKGLARLVEMGLARWKSRGRPRQELLHRQDARGLAAREVRLLPPTEQDRP